MLLQQPTVRGDSIRNNGPPKVDLKYPGTGQHCTRSVDFIRANDRVYHISLYHRWDSMS